MIAKLDKRTTILAGAATLLVVLLGVDMLLAPASVPPVAVTPSEAPRVAPPPPGAPDGLDLEALRTRYAPIRKSRAFQERSFRPSPKPASKPAERREPVVNAGPQSFKLRLTGLIGPADSRTAVLEEGGTGRGVLATSGLKLGEAEVSAVQTGSLVLLAHGKTQELSLGETVSVPPEFRSKLTRLSPKSKSGASSRRPASSSSSTPAVEISEEKKMSILERLKSRRASSLTGDSVEEKK